MTLQSIHEINGGPFPDASIDAWQQVSSYFLSLLLYYYYNNMIIVIIYCSPFQTLT